MRRGDATYPTIDGRAADFKQLRKLKIALAEDLLSLRYNAPEVRLGGGSASLLQEQRKVLKHLMPAAVEFGHLLVEGIAGDEFVSHFSKPFSRGSATLCA